MSRCVRKRDAHEVILGEEEDKRTRGCGEEEGREVNEDDYQIPNTAFPKTEWDLQIRELDLRIC